MTLYFKTPVLVQAIKFSGTLECFVELEPHNGSLFQAVDTGAISIQTADGYMAVNEGDYVIKGVRGELYPVKADIFEETYKIAPGNCLSAIFAVANDKGGMELTTVFEPPFQQKEGESVRSDVGLTLSMVNDFIAKNGESIEKTSITEVVEETVQ